MNRACFTILVDKVDQLGDDLLKRRMLILLRCLLVVMVVLVVFRLSPFGFRRTNIWQHSYLLKSIFHLYRQPLVQHKDQFGLHPVQNVI